jgi:hypothetical protein
MKRYDFKVIAWQRPSAHHLDGKGAARGLEPGAEDLGRRRLRACGGRRCVSSGERCQEERRARRRRHHRLPPAPHR